MTGSGACDSRLSELARVLGAVTHTQAIVDPKSIIVRFFSAEFGAPNPATGKVDDWLEITR
jgi:hypothetical protein